MNEQTNDAYEEWVAWEEVPNTPEAAPLQPPPSTYVAIAQLDTYKTLDVDFWYGVAIFNSTVEWSIHANGEPIFRTQEWFEGKRYWEDLRVQHAHMRIT